MARTRHFRDLLVWQRAMELAREVYLRTEEFPKSETFGLRMQMRRSAVSVASHIAEGHGKLTDAELRRSLGSARGSLYEFETQNELACGLRFIDQDSSRKLLELATETAKLINGLLGKLEP
ncbi:MAG: four helix bundle protein [Terracidiphilus sp.]|jgi:four helix bundle protein